MQKYFLLIFSLFALKLQIHAQNSIGLVFGTNESRFYKLEGPDAIDFASRKTINFGAAFDLAITSQFSIQMELRYTQMGGRINSQSGGSGNPIIDTLSLNYLTYPLLFKYKFGTDQFNFFILCGPRLGFAVGEISYDGDRGSYSISYDEAAFNRFDLGLEFGGGVTIKLGIGDVFIDARNYHSLKNLNTHHQPIDVFEGCIVQNTSIGINIGYLFPIGINK